MDVIKEKIKNYVDAVIGNGIYDIIKKCLGLLLGGTFTSTIVNISIDLLNISFLDKYRVSISVVIIMLAIIFILEFYDRGFKHKPFVPDSVGDYDVLKREVTFTYGKEYSIYELYLVVKSNIKGLSRLHGKYTWSGSDPATITCETKHCHIIPLTRKDSFIEYEVELRKKFRKGARAECKIVGNMPDSKHTFIPFFSTRITEHTSELIVNICIPPIYNVREIICEEIAIVRNCNEKSMVVLLDSEGKYSWVIPNPKLFYVYSVRWEL